MDEQWNDRAIWLGHLWMQSFLGRWLFRTSTPTDQLQKCLAKLDQHLPYPDLCRVLSLQFPFPGCGETAREDLFLFLGAAHEAYPLEQMDRVQRILEAYLQQMPDPLAAPAPASSSAPGDKGTARYTSLLKEKGDTEGVVPQHSETMVQESPPVWRATASYQGVRAVAEGKSKKEARHQASKEVYVLLSQ